MGCVPYGWKADIDRFRRIWSPQLCGRVSFLPRRGTVIGLLAAVAVLFLIGMPALMMALQSTAGCEGLPAPCQPDNTALNVTLLAVSALVIGTWWGVRRLVNSNDHSD